MKMTPAITRELARALGVPPNARRAVLTLEVGELPRLDCELLPSRTPTYHTSLDPAAVAALPYILRMRFEDAR